MPYPYTRWKIFHLYILTSGGEISSHMVDPRNHVLLCQEIIYYSDHVELFLFYTYNDRKELH